MLCSGRVFAVAACMYVCCGIPLCSMTMEGATKFAANKRTGFVFLFKNGEWTKKQLHGKYRWRNEKNVHGLPMYFFENNQHSMSGTNIRKNLDGIIGFLDKRDGSPLSLCFFHGKKRKYAQSTHLQTMVLGT